MATDKYKIEFGIVGINKLQKYQQGLQATNNQLRELKKQIRGQKTATSAQANQLSRLTAQQQLYNSKVKEGIKNLKGNANKLREYNKANKNTAKTLAKLGISIAAATQAFRSMSRFLVQSVKDFAAYERGVKNVLTLLSTNDKNMFSESLYKGAKDVAREFGFTLSDVNKAMFNSVSAGVSAANAVDFLRTASVLAIAGVTDLKSAALGLTTVLNAYRMSADEATRVSEIFFTTQKFGVTTVEELSKAIGVVVPFAATSGISFEELGASIAVTTRSGLDAAKTVTALRAAISQMQKPAAESRDLFLQLGVPIGSAELEMMGYAETMKRLNDIYKENPAHIEKMFGNVRGLTAVFSIAGSNIDEYNRFLKVMHEDTGDLSSLQLALAENMNSADVKINQMTQSIDNLKTSIGSSSWFIDFVDSITDLFDILDSDNLSKLNKFMYFASFMMPTGGRLLRQSMDVYNATQNLLDSEAALRHALLQNTENLDTAFEKLKSGNVRATKELTEEEMADIKLFLDATKNLIFTEHDVRLKEFFDTFTEYTEGVNAENERLAKEEKLQADAMTKLRREFNEREMQIRVAFRRRKLKETQLFNNGERKSDEDVFKFKNNLILLELRGIEELLAHKGLSADMEVDLEKRKTALLMKQAQNFNAFRIQDENKTLNAIRGLQQDALNKSTSFISESLSISLKNKEKDFAAEKERIDKEVEYGVITKKQAEKKKDDIDRKSFQTRKKHEKKMALINYIKELTNIRVQAAANPLNAVTFGAAGISQYAVMAALATAAYAGNLANINAQKFAKGGMVYGNSHAQGGEKFAVGGRVVELEGGEAVINKRSTAMFGDTLSAMNVAGGGASFSSPNFGSKELINYNMLANAISKNINVVLPVDSLNKVQNRVKVIESQSKY